jgi:DNA-binding beta-propeller fold protein YncE
MADKKISELNAGVSINDADLGVIVQTAETKKVTLLIIANYILGKIGAYFFGLTPKTTPVDADTITINDTEAGNVLKKVTFTNLKAFFNIERVQTSNVATTFDLDFALYESFDLTMTGATTFSVINAPTSKVVKLVLVGNFAPNFSGLASVVVKGTYVGAARNVIAISVINNKFDVNIG